MPRFRIDSIAALARQMKFTPHAARAAQLLSAEELLHTIDPAKAYPLDYLVFRITGYHPRNVGNDLLTGLALQHDLGVLIEHVSNTLNLRTSDVAEPVLGIEDLTGRFNVASKTIQRWRRRGLPARRFVFADGRRRVGFLLSSVERFFAVHREQVAQGTSITRIEPGERDEILRRARRLASEGRCCEGEIARRIGRRLRRSPMMVLHTLRKHDEENADRAILPLAAAPICPEERARIIRGFGRGVPLRMLAGRVGRPRAMICRVILELRIEKLSRRRVRFIDDPLYHQAGAASAIEAIANQQALMESPPSHEMRVPPGLAPYLAALYRQPLLTPAEERGLFLKFNFQKFQFVQNRRRLDPQFARVRDLDVLEGHLQQAIETRNRIVQANLRLVVSIARKHLRPGLDLMELISEGNVTLMRAVEGFDIHRGNRFSTYATLALMKGFARSVPQMLTAATVDPLDDRVTGGLADGQSSRRAERIVQRDQLQHLLSHLDDRERRVLRAYYGLGDEAAGTFEQVGRRLGLSKQRVRQIERSALLKLRAAAGIR